jgi:hypothetical protein
MTEIAGKAPPPRVSRKDRLVPLSRAALVLGCSKETLLTWHAREAFGLPVVRTFTGQRCTYASWLDAVMGSARPGAAGDMAQVTRQWWAMRFPDVAEEVA